jgi:hypothetical protein
VSDTTSSTIDDLDSKSGSTLVRRDDVGKQWIQKAKPPSPKETKKTPARKKG